MQPALHLDMPLLITIGVGIFNLGILVGVFSTRFVTSRRCVQIHEKLESDLEKRFESIWRNVDGIKDALTGGKIKFELRMINEQSGA